MKQFSEVAHLYIGCEVEFGFEGRKKIGKLVGKVEPFGWQVFDPSNVLVPYHNVRDELIKPLLRPLSDMTEEEMKEIWAFIFGKPFHKNGRIVFIEKKTISSDPRWILMSGVERLGIELNGTVWADSDLSLYKHNQHEVTLYLLSRSFDLFGLIESGQAIDKTKTIKQ